MALASLDFFNAMTLNINTTVGTGSSDWWIICGKNTDGQEPSLDNVNIQCTILLGNAIRTDGGPDNIVATNSTWSQPIYACASASRAKMRAPNSASWNGTTEWVAKEVTKRLASFPGTNMFGMDPSNVSLVDGLSTNATAVYVPVALGKMEYLETIEAIVNN